MSRLICIKMLACPVRYWFRFGIADAEENTLTLQPRQWAMTKLSHDETWKTV
jgi:hypothetical protein